MAATVYLADTSVYVLQRQYPQVRERFAALLTEGRLAACEMTALEYLNNAASPAGYQALWAALHGQRWMLLAALLCLVLGALTSYIRARAEAAGLRATVGIAERAERLIVVLVGTGLTGFPGLHVPYVLAIALWLLVAASTITVWQRIATVYEQTRPPAHETVIR